MSGHPLQGEPCEMSESTDGEVVSWMFVWSHVSHDPSSMSECRHGQFPHGRFEQRCSLSCERVSGREDAIGNDNMQ